MPAGPHHEWFVATLAQMLEERRVALAASDEADRPARLKEYWGAEQALSRLLTGHPKLYLQ